MITKEQLEEIREKTDIAELIGEYLPLKKVGKNLRALCPFHSEKDPSFYVNPEKRIFYCFGCQVGGDALAFVIKYENLDFPSAVEKLGKRVGISITRGVALDKYEEYFAANEFAAVFFHSILAKDLGRRGNSYFTHRAVTRETIEQFRLGYAPVGGGLTRAAKQQGFGVEKLIKVGLVTEDRTWEHMRDRVVFPIFNLGGRVIGFGGRRIDERNEPKYLNSPESPVFRKGDGLFGLYQARDSIKLANMVLLVEGYFDHISLFQAGILNVVAPLGTAFTENQARLLSRFCKRVSIFFDGDLSGIRAALRAIGLLISTQVEVKVVSLPSDRDPDSFIREKGSAGVNQLVTSAVDFLDFYKQAKSCKSLEDEIALIKEIAQILGQINDPIRFEKYIKHTSKLFEISEDSLKKEILGKKREVAPPKPAERGLEMMILARALASEELFAIAKDTLTYEDFEDKQIAGLFKELAGRAKVDFNSALELLEDEAKRKSLIDIGVSEEKIDRLAFDRMVKKFKQQREEKRIKKLLNEAARNKDEKAIQEYQRRLLEIKKFSF